MISLALKQNSLCQSTKHLLAYQHRAAPFATDWIISTGNGVEGTTGNGTRDQIPGSSRTFPLLINSDNTSWCGPTVTVNANPMEHETNPQIQHIPSRHYLSPLFPC